MHRIEDDFGIYQEVNLLKYCELCVLVYVVYSQLCQNGMIQQKVPAILLLLTSIFVVIVVVITVPVLRVLFDKITQVLHSHQMSTRPRVNAVIVVPVGKFQNSCSSCTSLELNTISHILADDVCAKKFREHALRHWCAENVDFCLEVAQYRRVCDLDNIVASTDLHVQNCFARFMAIVEEFVKDGAPCEVNLSGQQKATILQVKNFKYYQELGAARLGLFDEAEKEIAHLLKENLLGSFES